LCIGGMVVARSMNDRALGDKLRESATKVALELGGWGKKKRAQRA
jgi:TetR/AcrR family transcriptional repressor of nem operon